MSSVGVYTVDFKYRRKDSQWSVLKLVELDNIKSKLNVTYVSHCWRNTVLPLSLSIGKEKSEAALIVF